MTKCRVSEDELANDKGDAPEDTVSALDFRHDKEYEERFFDEIVNDTATIKAVIELIRNPSIDTLSDLRLHGILLSENAARELSE